MSPMIRYCCFQMEGLLNRRGRRGLAVAITTDNVLHSGLVFILESRSVDEQDESRLIGMPNVPVYTRSSACIKYCPWCGKNLKTHYSRYARVLPIIPNLLESTFYPHTDQE